MQMEEVGRLEGGAAYVAKEVDVRPQLLDPGSQRQRAHRLGQVWVVEVALLWQQGLRMPGEWGNHTQKWVKRADKALAAGEM